MAGSYTRFGSEYDPDNYPGAWDLDIPIASTGLTEQLVLQIPQSPIAPPVPLLVVFHKYNVSHGDALLNTSFLEEASDRGWYAIAPLSADQSHFGDPIAQQNTLGAIEFALEQFGDAIDPERIYGIGFSMGGGAMLSFAARHQNILGPRFAALSSHTGTVSLAHAYEVESAPIQTLMEERIGDPVTDAYQYVRLSSVNLVTVPAGDPLDPADVSVEADTDMVRNLNHIPIQVSLADADPLTYLATQTVELDAHLTGINPGYDFNSVVGSTHSWDTITEADLCDWIEAHTLTTPTNGDAQIDRDEFLYGPFKQGGDIEYLHFRLLEDVDAARTQAITFVWSRNLAANRLSLIDTSNLARLSVDVTTLGLVYSGTMRLSINAADSTGDVIRYLNVPAAPATVTRDAVSQSYTYDSTAKTLTISEPGPTGTHAWVITF